jgi:hypothetical protein
MAPRSPHLSPAATRRREEVHGSNAEFSGEPHEPMDRKVLKPAFESGEITDADPELGSEFLLRQAPIDS